MEYKVKMNDKEITVTTWMSNDVELIDHESWMVLADAAGIQIEDANVWTNDNKRYIAKVTARDATGRQATEISEYVVGNGTSDNIADQFAARMAFKRAVDDCIKRLLRLYLEEAGMPRHLYTDIQIGVEKTGEPCTRAQISYLCDIIKKLDRVHVEAAYDVISSRITKDDMSAILKALTEQKNAQQANHTKNNEFRRRQARIAK